MSEEHEKNRKRPVDELDEVEETTSKKIGTGDVGEASSSGEVELRQAAIKILCPSAYAGALIGKGRKLYMIIQYILMYTS